MFEFLLLAAGLLFACWLASTIVIARYQRRQRYQASRALPTLLLLNPLPPV